MTLENFIPPKVEQLRPIVLASGSPRRRELLSQIGITFDIITSNVCEDQLAQETPEQYVERLSREKAAAVSRSPAAVVIGADTTVVLDGAVVGKPIDADDAFRILTMLSGKWHRVLTACTCIDAQDSITRLATTNVRFRELSGPEIDAYIATGIPFDKAGAYAVQSTPTPVTEVQGSYSNVMGLDIEHLLVCLRHLNAVR